MPVFLNVIFYYLDQQFLLLWLWVHANRKLIKKKGVFSHLSGSTDSLKKYSSLKFCYFFNLAKNFSTMHLFLQHHICLTDFKGCCSLLSVLTCLLPARCSAAVSRLEESPGGVWPAGGEQGLPDAPPSHHAAGHRQRRGQVRPDPKKLWACFNHHVMLTRSY